MNGKAVDAATSGGSFVAIQRVWRAGDVVTLTLPQEFRTEAIDELHPGTVALMRGPVQYVALHNAPDMAEGALPVPGSLKAMSRGSQTFVATQAGQPVVYMPLYTVRSETYTTYFTRA